MKIFLATSITGQVDAASGEVVPEYRTFITKVLESLRDEGEEVFCAAEYEGWKVSQKPPEAGVQIDLKEIDAADVVLALLPERRSTGLEFEIGYTIGKGKRLVLAHQASNALGYFDQGLVSSGLAAFVTYENISTLQQQLPIALNSPQD